MFNVLSCKPDMYQKNVYYVVDFYDNKIARISKTCDGCWLVWYYHEKYHKLRHSIKETLWEIEYKYKKRSREIQLRSSGDCSPLF